MPTTPYTNMLLPIVSVTLGPIWASEVNAAFGVIDAHDHSSGKGTPVRTAGIYLDADLDFRGTNSKNARSARFALQTSLLGGISDVCCVYFSGADLYANDSAGNQIQITSGGGIAGTSGSISGLASPASVVYTPATKLFKFYSGSNIWASMQTGPITISEAVLNGKGVTVSVPVGLATAYGLELPAALPASTKFLTLASSGTIAAGPDVANGIARSNLAAVEQQTSYDSGGASTSSNSYSDVFNLTVTIITTGRPVIVMIQPSPGSTNGGFFELNASSGPVEYFLKIVRDATDIVVSRVLRNSSASAIDLHTPSCLSIVDTPAAGTHTYKVQHKMDVTGRGLGESVNATLIAYEL
jgi:hypothetical protein